jgi:hypothetical protein
MRQFLMYGSVRGASGNRRPYRDRFDIGAGIRALGLGRKLTLQEWPRRVAAFVPHEVARRGPGTLPETGLALQPWEGEWPLTRGVGR